MNNYQDILNSYNQIQNLSITYSSKEKNHVYKHINLIYTDSGIPYIEMYPGDQIELIKKVFVNTKEVFGTFEDEIDFSINDSEQNVGLTYNASTNIISAIKPGSYKIESNKFGMIDISKYDIANYNDPDILIIIKEVPEIKEILWGFNSNPLLVNVKDNSQEIFIKVNAKYSDGTIKELEPDFIYNNFNILSSNKSLGIICVDLMFNVDEPKITNIKLCLDQYKDQLKLSLVTKTENSILKNVKLPNDLQVITYFNENEIEDIKQAIYYIYYLTDNENDISVNKQYYIEKNTPTLFYVKMLNGYYEHGEFKIVDDKDVSRFSSLSSESSNIEISMDEYDNSFIITGVNEVDNVVIKLNTSLPQANDVTFNQISVIDSIKKLTWQINNNVITEIDNNVITKHVNNIDINVTDLHNVLLNEVICETLSGKIIHIEMDCVFNSTQKDSSDVNENLSIDNNKMIVNKSHECKIIFNVSNKYKLPSILETCNSIIVNIVMTKEYIFCDKIEIYEKNDLTKKILNDEELELKTLTKKTLYAKVYPNNATYKDVQWSSSNLDVATINNAGELELVGSGNVTIYCSIKYPDRSDAESEEYPDLYDPITGELINMTFNPPDVSAKINIQSTKINVTEISFDKSSITLYVDKDPQNYYIRVKPEGASVKDVELKIESDDLKSFFAIKNNDEIYAYRAGTGKLVAYSVDDPSITAEMVVIGIDTRVQRVKIKNPGNDNDYEFYDDYFNSPETTYVNKQISEEKQKNKPVGRKDNIQTEKYDDDDFARYYCPINNSIQLSATIEPTNAINSDIVWGSQQDFILVNSKKGIFTPIKRTPIEMEYDNFPIPIKNSRYPNAWWVSAVNNKYGKGDVAQLRVFRNQITAINIGYGTVHDYDEDNFDSNGELINPRIEYNYDYVIYRGSKIEVPITLSVQDPNFGPSNNIEWLGSTQIGALSWGDIISQNNYNVNHLNANEDFNWINKSPASINNDKKDFIMEITGEKLGSINIYARVAGGYDDYSTTINGRKYHGGYYTSMISTSGTTNEYGIVKLNDKYIKVEAYVKNYTRIMSIKDYQKLTGNYNIQGDGSVQFKYNGYIELKNVNVQFASDGYYSISVPVITDDLGYPCYIDNKYTDTGVKIKVTIGSNLNENNVTNAISNCKFVILGIKKYNKVKQILDVTDNNGNVFCPSPNANEDDITLVSGNFLYMARPGTGEIRYPEYSRSIKIRVVDTPNKIYVCPRSMKNILNVNLPQYHYQSTWISAETLKIKGGSSRRYPMFIWFDEWSDSNTRFTEILFESAVKNVSSSNDTTPVEIPLDDKYMSYAVTSYDPTIVRIVERNDDDPMVPQSFGNFNYDPDGDGLIISKPIKKIDFNKLGYGRYFVLKPESKGKTKIAITNIMSGRTEIRSVEVI